MEKNEKWKKKKKKKTLKWKMKSKVEKVVLSFK